jgi:three-Cys-motif partner protein
MCPTLPKAYQERPQSYIKHLLLESYLEKLVLIVGRGASQICYVDCFAGPWGGGSDDMASTSIGISLTTLNKCRESLGGRGVYPEMRALYIERDPAAFATLSAYLKQPRGRVKADCMQGDFLDLRSKILDWIGSRSAFAFLFIDPKGWKEIGVPTLTELLQRPRSEFLINFMYNDINRTMSMADWQPQMRGLLGEPLNLEGLTPDERERKIVDTYRTNCAGVMPSQRGYRGRSAYARVMDPEKRRTKYELVYLTTHPLGVIKFMEISEDVEEDQQRLRGELRMEKRQRETGIADLFSEAPIEGARGTTRPMLDELESFWLTHLTRTGGKRRIGLDGFADILEQTAWFPGELQSSLLRLIKTGKVRNIDAGKARSKRPLHYEANNGAGETLVLEGYI